MSPLEVGMTSLRRIGAVYGGLVALTLLACENAGPTGPAPELGSGLDDDGDAPDSASDESDDDSGDDGPGGGGDSKWCSALHVFETRCQQCHGEAPKGGAPMSLTTYKDLVAPAVTNRQRKVYEVVSDRIHDTKRPMPERPAKLSAAELASIDDWIADGAQEGANPKCAGADDPAPTKGADEEAWPVDCEETYVLRANDNGQPHSVAPGIEEHPQFIFDAPWGDDPVQALAFRPLTDNAKVLHHWILYEGESQISGKFLTSWSPGKDGLRTFPDDVGVYLPSGRRALRLDMHYYNLAGTQEELDRSGVEVCVTRSFRPNTATVNAFIGSATAPPGHTENTRECDVETKNGAVYLLASSPHMHRLGVHAKLLLTRNGVTTSLHDEPFDFENQTYKDLDRVELHNGDKITISCAYDNPSNRVVRFGQNSDDEMCFNFAMYYPMGNLKCGSLLEAILGI